jgi:gluconolactonase
LNNYFGRQFNSLNDVAIHPTNKDIYFTDTIYGYVQDFRPAPGLQDQVYRFNPDTGAVTIAADGFDHPNGMSPGLAQSNHTDKLIYLVGLTFSPDGEYAYVADTGINSGFFGLDFTRPASMYVFVLSSRTLSWFNGSVKY